MFCTSANNASFGMNRCSYTCDIDALMAQYPHVNFNEVFCLIFSGLRDLEECC
ncbi:MAG: hypothetical protein ACOX05_06815 [Bacillota bacterium]|jgi:hypothetical protein